MKSSQHLTTSLSGFLYGVLALAALGWAPAAQAELPATGSQAQLEQLPAAPAPRFVAEEDDPDADAGPPLAGAVIKDVILARMNAIKHCYDKELKKNADLTGKVVVHFVIGATGSVNKAEIKESTLKNSDVEQCMLEEIKTWQFPEPRGGKPVDVNFPFKFSGAS